MAAEARPLILTTTCGHCYPSVGLGRTFSLSICPGLLGLARQALGCATEPPTARRETAAHSTQAPVGLQPGSMRLQPGYMRLQPGRGRPIAQAWITCRDSHCHLLLACASFLPNVSSTLFYSTVTGLSLKLARAVPMSATAWSECPLGSAPARLPRLLRARLAALGSSALPGGGWPCRRPATASGARASRPHSRRLLRR